MGMACGTPIPTTVDGPQIGAAECAAIERLHKLYEGCLPDVLWRVEAVSYSTCHLTEYDAEVYGSTKPRLELFTLNVHNWTPKGATLEDWSGCRRRWVNLEAKGRRYACRTPQEALESFIERRKSQVRILTRQLARAESELSLATEGCLI